MSTDTHVAVIGAGQAGLAMGHHLTRLGCDFLLLDAATELGASWRGRWDSLRLFTPARHNGLPGLPFPGHPGHHPGKDAVADYLTHYAATFDLPVRLGTRVTGLHTDNGALTLTTTGHPLRAHHVVMATGPFQTPHIPAAATGLSPQVTTVHSAHYRNPASLPDGPVLVVGSGNSGAQIAAELTLHGRHVFLSGRTLPHLPQRILGRDLFQVFDRLGLLTLDTDSALGRRMRNREAVIGTDLRTPARHGLLTRLGPITAADGHRVTFTSGAHLDVNTVIWATGHRHHLPWLAPGLLHTDGRPRHTRGRTPLPGLYVLGLPWQTHRASALLAGVGRDAALLAAHITTRPASRTPRKTR